MSPFEEVRPGVELLRARSGPARCCNTWLVDGLLVEPNSSSHADRLAWPTLLDTVRGRVHAVFLTHWHGDHSGGLESFAAYLGVPFLAPEPPRGRAVRPTRVVSHG